MNTDPDMDTQEQKKSNNVIPKRVLRHIFRVIVILATALLVIVAAGVLSLHTPLVEGRFCRLLEKTLSSRLNGAVHIGGMKGTYFTEFILEDIVIEGPDQIPVVSIDRFSVRYLISRLFSDTIRVDTTRFDGLRLYLSKTDDGTWNIQHLIKSGSSDRPETESARPFRLQIDRIDISNSTIRISTSGNENSEGDMALSIDRFYAGFQWQDTLALSISDASLAFSGSTTLPFELSGSLGYSPASADLSFDALFQTKDSRLSCQGSCQLAEGSPAFDLTVVTAPLNSMELADMLAVSGLPDGDIEGAIKLSGSMAEFRHEILLTLDHTRLDETGSAGYKPARGLWTELSCHLEELDLSEPWLPVADPISGKVSGDFTLSANRLESPDKIDAVASGNIEGLSAYDIPLDLIQFNAAYNGKILTLDPVTVSAGDTHLGLAGDIDPDSRTATLDLEISSLNPDDIVKQLPLSLPGPLSGLSLEGKTDISVAFNGWMDRIDTRFSIRTQRVAAPPYQTESIDARGIFRFHPGTGIQFEDLLISLMGLDGETISAEKISLGGNWEGWLETPEIDLSMTVLNVIWNDPHRISALGLHGEALSAGKISLNGEWEGWADAPDIDLAMTARNITWNHGDDSIREISISGGLVQDLLTVSFRGEHENGSFAEIDGSVSSFIHAEKEIRLNTLQVATKAPWSEHHLSSLSPVLFSVGNGDVSIHDCRLVFDDTSFSLSGLFSPKGSQNLHLSVDSFNLADLPDTLRRETQFAGTLSGEISVTGPLSHPDLTAGITIEDLTGHEVSWPLDLSLSADYTDTSLSFEGNVNKEEARLLSASGEIPAVISLVPFSVTFPDKSMLLALKSNELKFSELPLPSFKTVQWDATANMSLSVSGTFDTPLVNGNITLSEGRLALPAYNLTYETLEGTITVLNNRLQIDDLLIQGDREGRLTTSGSILIKDRHTLDADLSLVGNDFFIPYEKSITARLSPDLHLNGNLKAARLSGDVTITESKLDLDQLSRQRYSDIQVVQNAPEDGSGMVLVDSGSRSPGFFSSLSADILVHIPNNAWIKGQDVNAELFGEITVKKISGGPFLLSGPLSVLRGNYYFMGKNFQLTDGGLEFIGLREINPKLDITCQTKVSSSTIIANLHGTAREMAIDLSSDPEMEESDIISYLVFGRATDDLGGDQAFSVEKTALSYTGGLLAVELRNLLGDLAFFDAFSIDSSDSENGFGAVTLGKYLTPKLFLSHHQGLSEGETSYQELHYELTPQIKLETQIGTDRTSTVDLTWEFDF
jgi:autotransporter translocation and assembly factor TamB